MGEVNNISNIIGHITKLIPSITALEKKLGKIKDGARDETLEAMLESIKKDSEHLKKYNDESSARMRNHVSKLKSITAGSKSDSDSSDSEDDAAKPT